MSSSKHVLIGLDAELRGSVEAILNDGESLKCFVREAVRVGVERRKRQREFLTEALARREQRLSDGCYVEAEEVISRLENILKSASAKQG
ncbi:hypothetical protein [Dyella sp. Tek66A03]|uniref:hypothetical protein n=1 Tax=Dyella sp. Tek66A03 TaxID=3458298 RepID=UPI00403E6107